MAKAKKKPSKLSELIARLIMAGLIIIIGGLTTIGLAALAMGVGSLLKIVLTPVTAVVGLLTVLLVVTVMVAPLDDEA